MAKKLFKNKSLWKKIGIGAVAGVLGIGAIMGVGALLDKEEETTKVIKPAYEIGALAEDGTYLESKGSIYTKEAFECQGLDIDLDFKSNVSYRVFFYDDENFLSSTGDLTENYDETTTPSLATYARILITPNDDDKISWYEKSGYANQLTISVNKDQLSFLERVTSGENVYTCMGQGTFDMTTKQFTKESNSGWYFSGIIDTSLAKEIIIKLETAELTRTIDRNGEQKNALCYFDLTNKKSLTEVVSNPNIIATEGKFSYISINCENFDEFVFATSSFAVDTTAVYLV
ncbi:MAG: hypothetical protein IJA61_02080 [Clostridia bacterium]|nr:hypothetical protein [Clostridia bacterium]